jgi:hypothetical protein
MLYIALLHYPVYNKEGKIVTTAIANADIHDIARAAKTYGIKGFYIVNPIDEQRNLAEEIVNHWRDGYGADFNKFRQAAFELVIIRESLQIVVSEIAEKTGHAPKLVVTGANISGNVLKFDEFRKILQKTRLPHLLVFGTGSGISDEVINVSDYRIEPIKGVSDYNHLSVRSAVAIMLNNIRSV